jgi:1-acyl-sn-glycerol-3-phosphate acyltransferase
MLIVRRLYVVYALLLFVATLIPVFILALGASLLGEIQGGNLIYLICRTWGDVWFALVGIFHRNIYEHKPRRSEPCIFVCNHTTYLDSALIVKAARYPVRPLGKIEMTKIPLFGFVYRKTIVVVDRSNPEARAESVRKLVYLLNKGISAWIFPEGSINETEAPIKPFYNGAARIAIETGKPIQPVLFLDAYKRMHARDIWSLTPGRSRAVFLEPISVDGYSMEDADILISKVHDQMQQKLLSYRHQLH